MAKDLAIPGLSLAWNGRQVVALRLAKIGRGGKRRQAESHLMVAEKIAAAVQVQMVMARTLLRGKGPAGASQVTRLYARKVAASCQRLSKSS